MANPDRLSLRWPWFMHGPVPISRDTQWRYIISLTLYSSLLIIVGFWCSDCLCWIQHCEHYWTPIFPGQGCSSVSHWTDQTNTDLADCRTRYIPAKITIVAVNAAAIIVSTALRIMYGRRNSTADRLGTPARSPIETRLAEKGEVQDVHDDKNFRYVFWAKRNFSALVPHLDLYWAISLS